MKKYTATYYKDETEVRKVFDVVSVRTNKKYHYFEIVQVIYHHEIITIAYYQEVNRIVLKDEDGNRKEITHDE